MGSNLKALWAKIKATVSDLWDKDKGIFILIAIAALIVKFRDIIIDILVQSSKNVQDKAEKKDAQLASQESDAKAQADQAVADAAAEPAKQEPVTDDWYKKDN
jgi:hypothetical protein